MAGFSSDFSCLTKMSRDIQKIGAGVKKSERTAVSLAGQAYANDVKAIAPYKTGTYRRSIHVEIETEGLRQVALIGTDLPYGKRLEYGFFGKTDSLGRVFHQFPRPHWRPCWDHNLPKYRDIMLGIVSAGASGKTLFNYTDYFDPSQITDDIVDTISPSRPSQQRIEEPEELPRVMMKVGGMIDYSSY